MIHSNIKPVLKLKAIHQNFVFLNLFTLFYVAHSCQICVSPHNKVVNGVKLNQVQFTITIRLSVQLFGQTSEVQFTITIRLSVQLSGQTSKVLSTKPSGYPCNFPANRPQCKIGLSVQLSGQTSKVLSTKPSGYPCNFPASRPQCKIGLFVRLSDQTSKVYI